MMKFITQTFVKGLVVLLPILAATYVLVWLVRDSEAWIKGLLIGRYARGVLHPWNGIHAHVGYHFFRGRAHVSLAHEEVFQGRRFLAA